MTPAAAIAMLDRSLAKNGEDIVIRRYVGSGDVRVPLDVTVRAHVRGYLPNELVGGIVQGDTKLILAPTQIVAAAWPGPVGWPQVGDRIVIEGRSSITVQAAAVVRVAGTVVRIEIQARG